MLHIVSIKAHSLIFYIQFTNISPWYLQYGGHGGGLVSWGTKLQAWR
jgi:hypothetical protein